MGDHEMLVGSYLHYISVILLFFLFLGYQVKVLPYACRQERTRNEENVKVANGQSRMTGPMEKIQATLEKP